MPDDSVLIGILKWVALALALGSTLWGLLAPRPNREEIDGRKRITRSGAVTFAMILAGASVSALSLGLETALKARKDAEAVAAQALAERDKARSARDQRLRDALALATRADTRLGLAEVRAGRADVRAEAADARADALARDTRERLRDLELSRSVANGARNNLARTGEALMQIERVVQPLETLSVRVTWEIPGDAPGMREATTRLAAAGRSLRAAWLREWEEADDRKPGKVESFPVEPGEALYFGDIEAEKRLLAAMRDQTTFVAFFAANQSEMVIDRRLRAPRDGWAYGDLSFKIDSAPTPTIDYVIDTGAVRFTVAGTVALDKMGGSGAVVSYPDLERAIPIVSLVGLGLSSSRPVALSIHSRSRSYVLGPGAIRALVDGYRMPTLTPAQAR